MDSSKRLIAFTDIETSGIEKYRNVDGVLRPWNEICEIGLVLANPISLLIFAVFENKIQIKHPKRFSAKALEINGYNEKEWGNAVTLDTAINSYNQITENAVFAAHNITFDWGFMEVAYAMCKIKPALDYHRLDLYTQSKILLESRNHFLENYKQDTISEYLGMGAEPLPHRALQGAMRAFNVYKNIFKLIK